MAERGLQYTRRCSPFKNPRDNHETSETDLLGHLQKIQCGGGDSSLDTEEEGPMATLA